MGGWGGGGWVGGWWVGVGGGVLFLLSCMPDPLQFLALYPQLHFVRYVRRPNARGCRVYVCAVGCNDSGSYYHHAYAGKTGLQPKRIVTTWRLSHVEQGVCRVRLTVPCCALASLAVLLYLWWCYLGKQQQQAAAATAC